jgi:four helix bundle protein
LIREGHRRFTYPDQTHFCIQARGSSTETINHLIDAFDENYITAQTLTLFRIKGKEMERMLNGYIGFLRKKKVQVS